MKSKYVGICLVVLGMLFACSEEESTTSIIQNQPVHVVVNANSGGNDTAFSRLAYSDSDVQGEGVTVTWSSGDAFYLKGTVADDEGNIANGEMDILEKDTEYGAQEEFQGVMSKSLVENEGVIAYYPSAKYDVERNCFNVDVRRATQYQSDEMAHLSSMNYMQGKGKVNGGVVNVDFTGGNKVAIVRFDITIPALSEETSVAEFQIECENLNTVGTLAADDDAFIVNQSLEKHRQTILLDGYVAGTSETNISVYTMLLPTTLGEDMTIRIILANGNVYSNTVKFSNNTVLASNRYYIIKDMESLVEADYTWYTSRGKDALEYTIENEHQLLAFANIVNGDAPASVGQDDFSGQKVNLVQNVDLQADWIPVGMSEHNGSVHVFRGTFDGNGHTISNVDIYVEIPEINNSSYEYSLGFFGNIEDANIHNLNVIGKYMVEKQTVSNYGSYNIGGVVGHAVRSNFDGCHSKVDLTGVTLTSLRMGGMVGYLKEGTLVKCGNSGNFLSVFTTAPHVGGIVGIGRDCSVVACSNEKTTFACSGVNYNSSLGGIAGELTEGKNVMIASYSLSTMFTADGSGKNNIGGLAGVIGGDVYYAGKASDVFGCYTLYTNCKSDGDITEVSKGYMTVTEEEVNSEEIMDILNVAIADWNATLSGVSDPAYCRYLYTQGESHLVLQRQSEGNTGQLDDMENGGEIGKQL